MILPLSPPRDKRYTSKRAGDHAQKEREFRECILPVYMQCNTVQGYRIPNTDNQVVTYRY